MIKILSSHIEISREVRAAPEDVWDLLTDTSSWVDWGPSIIGVECSERYIRNGSEGRVRTIVGLWLPFVINDMVHGHRWSWNVGGVSAIGHRIDILGERWCRLIFEVPLFAAPCLLVCRIALGRLARMLEKPT